MFPEDGDNFPGITGITSVLTVILPKRRQIPSHRNWTESGEPTLPDQL